MTTKEVGRRRAGRPKTSLLSRELIISTAFEVLQATGADGFTMTRLAEALGVQTPALYNHVANKNAVLNGMRGRISRRMEPDVFARLPWDEAMIAWARSYRSAFAAHPEIIALLAMLPIDGERNVVENYEAVSSALVRGGWPETEIVSTIVATESFIIGSALDALAPVGNMDPKPHTDLAPTLDRGLRERKAQADGAGVSEAALTFEIGLEVLIDGLRARLKRLTA
ncbi:TetR/AcrR family transcriptional regulator C-terminal domain-containing protein [Saxibacter everestensis]|uniref:TetR/AcrR family transcriptional regulator C-terminal domain-containing protein n=1 Tax=Saxibacter everestensis TaxID=2909229 RepID=A0ABY8QSS6_9MICO|nr:TetR/AcrR family transcriptional regulator C-terminal domain-containing protein [Brevibacteriaceae bacterium ZFBP1038]